MTDPTPAAKADPPKPERAREDEIEAAIRVLVRGDRAAARRFLDYARATRLDLDQTWVVRNPEGGIDFTALAAPAAGRTAMIFGTRPNSKAEVGLAGDLLATVAIGCRDRGVDLAQALIDPSDELEEAMFIAGGFRRLAQLDYLERPVPRFGTIPSPELPADVRIEPWDGKEDELVDLLERTYEDTLDCPGLAGLRRTTDILAGHLASGTREPDWWHVLRLDGVPSGVLLFNRGSDRHSIELVYLGLARGARGRGLGRTLLTFGLAALDGDAARVVVLAVDRANLPAVRLYRRAGFRHSVRRTAMVRPLNP
ncbi:MAG: hypothetical protein CMJ27_04995 [Phycisphaerae bacterium]|nr:hypothetical protein [Phycisphaerae bacterium]OUX02201.1 MAG: hypothetical protein CBD91_03105 [Phycisphaeraceae bacterium TMED231]